MILHITTPSEWADAQRSGAVTPPSLASEGFIHCSTEVQLADTVARHFPAGAELLVLEVDETAVGTEVRWEESRPGGEHYPHIYGPLPVASVTAVRRWSTGADQPSDSPRSTST